MRPESPHPDIDYEPPPYYCIDCCVGFDSVVMFNNHLPCRWHQRRGNELT